VEDGNAEKEIGGVREAMGVMDTRKGVGVEMPETEVRGDSLGKDVMDPPKLGDWVGVSRLDAVAAWGVEVGDEEPLTLPPTLPVLAAETVAKGEPLSAPVEVWVSDPPAPVGDMDGEIVEEGVPATTLCVAPPIPKDGELDPLPSPLLTEGEGLKDTLREPTIESELLPDKLVEGLWERLGMEEGAWEGEGGVVRVASPRGDAVPAPPNPPPPHKEGEGEEEGEGVADTDTPPVLEALEVEQATAVLGVVGGYLAMDRLEVRRR
jgi:hypothetical protein